MIRKSISNILLAACFMCTTPSSTTNWLDTWIETPRPVENNSNSYMLFDNSGEGSMTKVYDQDAGRVKFIIPVGGSKFKIIPGDN